MVGAPVVTPPGPSWTRTKPNHRHPESAALGMTCWTTIKYWVFHHCNRPISVGSLRYSCSETCSNLDRRITKKIRQKPPWNCHGSFYYKLGEYKFPSFWWIWWKNTRVFWSFFFLEILMENHWIQPQKHLVMAKFRLIFQRQGHHQNLLSVKSLATMPLVMDDLRWLILCVVFFEVSCYFPQTIIYRDSCLFFRYLKQIQVYWFIR